jgi:hypothetical protein
LAEADDGRCEEPREGAVRDLQGICDDEDHRNRRVFPQAIAMAGRNPGKPGFLGHDHLLVLDFVADGNPKTDAAGEEADSGHPDDDKRDNAAVDLIDLLGRETGDFIVLNVHDLQIPLILNGHAIGMTDPYPNRKKNQ